MSRSKNFLASFSSGWVHFQVPTQPEFQSAWRQPRAPIMKINFDAVVFEDGVFQLGCVARDHTGVCRRWTVRRARGLVSPEVAEAYAAREAMVMAKDMGWTKVHFEGDCLVVVNALKDRNEESFRPYRVIVSACQELLSDFDFFYASFIRRTGNCLAHAFAHFSLFEFGYFVGGCPTGRFGPFHIILSVFASKIKNKKIAPPLLFLIYNRT